MVMVELYIGSIPATLPPKEEIVGMMVQDVEVGLNISATLHFAMLEKVFMVMREVYIGIRPALVPPIIQEILVDHQYFIVMVMTEVDIGNRPVNFLHITMVN